MWYIYIYNERIQSNNNNNILFYIIIIMCLCVWHGAHLLMPWALSNVNVIHFWSELVFFFYVFHTTVHALSCSVPATLPYSKGACMRRCQSPIQTVQSMCDIILNENHDWCLYLYIHEHVYMKCVRRCASKHQIDILFLHLNSGNFYCDFI